MLWHPCAVADGGEGSVDFFLEEFADVLRIGEAGEGLHGAGGEHLEATDDGEEEAGDAFFDFADVDLLFVLLENAWGVFFELAHGLEHLGPGGETVEELADVGAGLVELVADGVGECDLDFVDALDGGDEAFAFDKCGIEAGEAGFGEAVVGVGVVAGVFGGVGFSAGVGDVLAHGVGVVAGQVAFPPAFYGENCYAVGAGVFGLGEFVRLTVKLSAALSWSLARHIASARVKGYQGINSDFEPKRAKTTKVWKTARDGDLQRDSLQGLGCGSQLRQPLIERIEIAHQSIELWFVETGFNAAHQLIAFDHDA